MPTELVSIPFSESSDVLQPTELQEELVDFLGSPRPEVRHIALEHLVGYSQGPQNSIFKPEGLKAIKNLKVLVNDAAVHSPIPTPPPTQH